MSKEKLYAVKNDEGKYWDTGMPPWWDDKTGTAFKRIDLALKWAEKYDGHVVTLVEEPEKAVLTKEQAEIIEGANKHQFPANYITLRASSSDEEKLIMEAFANGYTVEKEKKYNVKVPYANYKWYLKTPDGKLDTICVKGLAKGFGGYPDGIELTNDDIENFGLQDCEKEEVADDEQ